MNYLFDLNLIGTILKYLIGSDFHLGDCDDTALNNFPSENKLPKAKMVEVTEPRNKRQHLFIFVSKPFFKQMNLLMQIHNIAKTIIAKTIRFSTLQYTVAHLLSLWAMQKCSMPNG